MRKSIERKKEFRTFAPCKSSHSPAHTHGVWCSSAHLCIGVAELGSLGQVCDGVDRPRRNLALQKHPTDFENRLRTVRMPCDHGRPLDILQDPDSRCNTRRDSPLRNRARRSATVALQRDRFMHAREPASHYGTLHQPRFTPQHACARGGACTPPSAALENHRMASWWSPSRYTRDDEHVRVPIRHINQREAAELVGRGRALRATGRASARTATLIIEGTSPCSRRHADAVTLARRSRPSGPRAGLPLSTPELSTAEPAMRCAVYGMPCVMLYVVMPRKYDCQWVPQGPDFHVHNHHPFCPTLQEDP